MIHYRILISLFCGALVLEPSSLLFSQVGRDINKRAVELGEKKRLNEAISEFDRVIVLRDNEAARVYHNKAYTLELKGDHREAIKNYEMAIQRNPYLVLSGIRLGSLYYHAKDYEKAVATGESVMKLDPKNTDVPKWLPDAKMKLARQQQKAAEDEKKRKKEEKSEKDEKTEKPGKDKEDPTFIYASIDAMLRTGMFYGRKYHMAGLYYTTPHGYRALSDEGAIVDIPYTMFLRIRPASFVDLELTVENPYLGSLVPSALVVQDEIIEAKFYIKKAIVGAGLMLNHYHSAMAFYRSYNLWDYKAGLVIGYNNNNIEAKFTWYPRMLIMDPATSKGKTMDAGLLKIDWATQLTPHIKLYGMIHARDYYIYNHSKDIYVAMYFARDFYLLSGSSDLTLLYAMFLAKSEHVSDYWGVYDIGIGIAVDNVLDRTDGIQLSIAVEWIERFYLRDLMNRNPYTLAPNGQGWFGLNLGRFTKGKPFSGFHAISQVLGVRCEERITRNFFMYQKAVLELADQKADHHEFNLKIGAGVKF